MAKFVSRRAEVGLAKEATRGTPVVPTQWLPWSTLAFADKAERVMEQSAMGRIEDSDNAYNTLLYGQGVISADVRVAYLGLILTNLFGAAPSTGAGPPYTHTYTLQQTNQHASLSILAQDKTNTDIIKMFPLTMINRWSLKITAGQIVTNEIEFMSLQGRDWTTQTSTFTALGDKFLHQHLQFKVAANVGALAAASLINVKELEFVIEKNLLRNDVAGSVWPDDINNQEMKVSGSVTLTYEDNTWLNYMTANTHRSMSIVLSNTSSGILTFQLPKVSFQNWEKDMPLSEIARQKLEFVGHYDAANALAVISTATLVNAVSAY